MEKNKIQQAGFRSNDGIVIGTGAFHDIEALPNDFDIKDEGFVTEEGTFLTREEAAQSLGKEGSLHSEDLDKTENVIFEELTKKISEYKFSEPVHVPEENAFAVTATHNGKQVGRFTFQAKPISDPNNKYFGFYKVGRTDVHPLHRGRGVNAKMIQAAHKHIKTKLKGKGLVSLGEWREEAATHSWDKLMQRVKGISRVPGIEGEDAPDFIFKTEDHLKNEFIVHARDWLNRRKKRLKKAEDYLALSNLLNYGLSQNDHEIANHMSGFDLPPEFEAAKFLSNKPQVSDDFARLCLITHEEDHELAALLAYDLPRTEEYKSMLQAVIKTQQNVQKAEPPDIDKIPHVVKPATPDAITTAEAIQQAYKDGNVHSVKLDGKHSKGASIAIADNKKYLIKPGSGKTSPALGASEELASQSRREVAFYKIAEALELDEWLPRADLCTFDDKEAAVMELLSGSYQGLNKLKKAKKMDPKKVFEPYRKTGILARWALLDYILGNADRHR